MKIYGKKRYISEGSGIALHSYQTVKDMKEPEHLHEFVEIVYIWSGNGTHGIDGVEYSVGRGSLLFINYKKVHHFSTKGKVEFINILLDPHWISEKIVDTENAFQLLTLSAFTDFQALTPGEPLLVFSGAERTRLERLLKQMKEEYIGREPGFDTVLKAQTNILLTLIFRKMLPKETGDDFLEYIRANCEKRLTLEELACQGFYNPSYFSRMFRKKNGMTVTEFIRRSRMEKAMDLLKNTDLSAIEVAEQSGFPSKTAFYQQFKEVTGQTPQQWRSKKTVPQKGKNTR